MDTAKRIRLIRMIEKMDGNPKYSKKLGLRNQSVYKVPKDGGEQLSFGVSDIAS